MIRRQHIIMTIYTPGFYDKNSTRHSRAISSSPFLPPQSQPSESTLCSNHCHFHHQRNQYISITINTIEYYSKLAYIITVTATITTTTTATTTTATTTLTTTIAITTTIQPYNHTTTIYNHNNYTVTN